MVGSPSGGLLWGSPSPRPSSHAQKAGGRQPVPSRRATLHARNSGSLRGSGQGRHLPLAACDVGLWGDHRQVKARGVRAQGPDM